MKEEKPYSFYALMLIMVAMLIGGWNNCTGQFFPDTVAYDKMEKFNWAGNWWTGGPTTGFFSNASISAPASAVIYGSGNGNDEFDWYSLPSIDTLDPLQEYKVQINLASYRFTSTGPASGVDIDDYVDIQVSTDGGLSYTSEVRVTGNSGAYWDYNSKTITKMVNGILAIYSPAGGGNRTLLGDGFSIVELTFPLGTKMIAIDILAVVDRSGEEWWFDNFFLLGSGSGGGSLPIVLSSFDAVQDGSQVNILWTVLSQVNNDYFTVERSTDCYDWEIVGECSGNGTSNQETSFVMIDRYPYSGLSYYRLKQTDYDEVFEIFDPVSVIVKDEMTIGLKIKPNPAINHIDLEMVYPETGHINSDIRIYNSLGDEVYKKFYIGKLNHINIDISKYKPGLYIVKSKLNHKSVQAKFIKKPEN